VTGLAVLLAAAAGPAAAAAGSPPASSSGGSRFIAAPAVFGTWNAAQPPAAVTYDQHLVPVGAAAVALAARGPRTVVGLALQGLPPDHRFGAHVHQKACGTSGADAGPHYQNVSDPVQPSVDPTYANPRNEVWLDFTTDAGGRAIAFTSVGWDFRAGGARSIVIHEHHTDTSAGMAGTAGARVACINVPLS
jgi:Cu-Zn family superoxide dismutase